MRSTFYHQTKITKHYTPEKTNDPDDVEQVTAKSVNQYAHFVECVQSCKDMDSSVELGYRSAIAAHMANLSYRREQRLALGEARQVGRQLASR